MDDASLAKDLPRRYRCKAVDWDRAMSARYPVGSPQAAMQQMMRRTQGRFFVVVRRPRFGREGGYADALCMADTFIKCAYISAMHMFKAMIKRFIKLLIHTAIDNDKRDSGQRVAKLQAICEAASRPFTLGADKTDGQYPEVITNWDFQPMWSLSTTKMEELVEAVGFDEPTTGEDGDQMASTSGSSSSTLADFEVATSLVGEHPCIRHVEHPYACAFCLSSIYI